MLALAASHGAQLAPAFAGPRYVCQGGSIRDQSIPSAMPAAWLSLAEAETRAERLGREALRAEADGRPIARILAREAKSLLAALEQATRWGRCAGWRA